MPDITSLYLQNKLAPRKEMADRQSSAIDFTQKLLDMGLNLDEAKKATNEWVQTGNFNPPTARLGTVPNPNNPNLPPLPLETRQDITPGSVRMSGKTAISELPTTEVQPGYLPIKPPPKITDEANKFFTSDEALSVGLPPEIAAKMSKAFNGKIPASAVEKAVSLESTKSNRDITLSNKEDQQQDKLESQAKNLVAGIRGDRSLARTEEQRDASIQAYNTIEQIKSENRLPSQIEYYDILGQMWKARTGSSPSDQAIRDLDAKTFKGDLGKAAQYFTGKPAGRTTQEVLQNIQDFAAKSGLQADKFHEAYMKSHLIKPKGLQDDRWTPILSAGRGLSFREATGYKEGGSSTSGPQKGDVENGYRFKGGDPADEKNWEPE